jgi:hypothetical protein
MFGSCRKRVDEPHPLFPSFIGAAVERSRRVFRQVKCPERRKIGQCRYRAGVQRRNLAQLRHDLPSLNRYNAKMDSTASIQQIAAVLERARTAAIDYYKLTGKPLGITGEIGEYEAARLLGLKLSAAREAGYDAIDIGGRRYQIKARCIEEKGPRKSQRIGSIKLAHPWDAVLLVILNMDFQATGIWQAERDAVTAAIILPGSKARNERGALAVSKFKNIGRKIWPT